MGRISERLTDDTTIGLDTSIFIYHLEAHPRYLPLTKELLAGVQAEKWQAITSTVTIMELTVHPWRLKQAKVAREYEALLVNFPYLTVADVTRNIARRAAQLRAEFRLRPADALQVATALIHGATAFVTNDHQLMRLGSLMKIVVLDELASPHTE